MAAIFGNKKSKQVEMAKPKPKEKPQPTRLVQTSQNRETEDESENSKGKPHIDSLILLLQQYTNACQRCILQNDFVELGIARTRLKSELEIRGVAKHFDWTETDLQKKLKANIDKLVK